MPQQKAPETQMQRSQSGRPSITQPIISTSKDIFGDDILTDFDVTKSIEDADHGVDHADYGYHEGGLEPRDDNNNAYRSHTLPQLLLHRDYINESTLERKSDSLLDDDEIPHYDEESGETEEHSSEGTAPAPHHINADYMNQTLKHIDDSVYMELQNGVPSQDLRSFPAPQTVIAMRLPKTSGQTSIPAETAEPGVSIRKSILKDGRRSVGTTPSSALQHDDHRRGRPRDSKQQLDLEPSRQNLKRKSTRITDSQPPPPENGSPEREPTRSPSSRDMIKSTSQSQKLNDQPPTPAINGPAVQLDYDENSLTKLKYEVLKNQSFDESPRAVASLPLPISHLAPDAPLADRLKHFATQSSKEQAHNFSRMSLEEWQESGDWFMERFQDLMASIRRARSEKRAIAQEFEDELAVREEAVRDKTDGLERMMRDMKTGGEGVLRGKK